MLQLFVVGVFWVQDHSGAICRGEDDNELQPGKFFSYEIQVLNRADDVLSLRWMWGASELGKLGLGEVTSSDSVPVAIRSFAKSDNPYKARMAGM